MYSSVKCKSAVNHEVINAQHSITKITNKKM